MRKLNKLITHEVLETLCSICLYLDFEGRRSRNPGTKSMQSHLSELSLYSGILRQDLLEENTRELVFDEVVEQLYAPSGKFTRVSEMKGRYDKLWHVE